MTPLWANGPFVCGGGMLDLPWMLGCRQVHQALEQHLRKACKANRIAIGYRCVQRKRPRGVLGSNQPFSPRTLESKSFLSSWDRFQSIWIDSETSIFRRFEPGSLSTCFRNSNLENPNMGPENPKLESEKFDFGPMFFDVVLMYSKI